MYWLEYILSAPNSILPSGQSYLAFEQLGPGCRERHWVRKVSCPRTKHTSVQLGRVGHFETKVFCSRTTHSHIRVERGTVRVKRPAQGHDRFIHQDQQRERHGERKLTRIRTQHIRILIDTPRQREKATRSKRERERTRSKHSTPGQKRRCKFPVHVVHVVV